MDVPVVRVFDTLTPTNAAAGDFELQYASLESQLDELSRTNPARSRAVWNAPEDSAEEENAARQLASEYFAKTAGKLVLTHDIPARNLWAGRYNEAAGELFEEPKQATVMELMVRERTELVTALSNGLELTPAASLILETYDRILPSGAEDVANDEALSEAEIKRATEDYKAELLSRYGDVFDLVEAEGKTQFTADDLKDLFGKALQVLQEKGEAAGMNGKSS